MSQEPHQLDEWMATILVDSSADLSELARKGHAEHGRGAVFVWPPKGSQAAGEFKASYVPASAAAFEHAGEHPKEKAARYDPEREYVAVFLDSEQNALTVLAGLVAVES